MYLRKTDGTDGSERAEPQERRLPNQSPLGKEQFQQEVEKLMRNLTTNVPIMDKLKNFSDEYWLRESIVSKNGIFHVYTELLVPDDGDNFHEQTASCVLLSWNRQDNIPGIPRLVSNVNAFETMDFDRSEIFVLFAKMMFLNGDCYNASMISARTVARLVQMELIAMLLDIIKHRDQEKKEEGDEEEEQKEHGMDLCTPPLTFGEVVAWLRDNCPMRLRRLVQYQTAEHRQIHKFDRVKPASSAQEKPENILAKREKTLPKDVRRFKEACPFLYDVMTKGKGEVPNLRFYTYSEYLQGENYIDLHQKAYALYLEEYRDGLSDETRQKLDGVKSISLYCPIGRKNANYAAMLHDFLGKPPLETDLIYVFDFLATDLVKEIVLMALRIRRAFIDNTETEAIEALIYLEAASSIRYENEHPRLLCGQAFNIPDNKEGLFPTDMTTKRSNKRKRDHERPY